MPRQKDLKRLVRARMKKTGEAYSAARAHILKSPRRKSRPAGDTVSRLTPPAAPAAPASPAAPAAPTQKQYAELAGMSNAVILEKTGRTWEDWVRVLDGHGADRMAHSEVARLLSTTYNVRPWWTQMVTVGYERLKGLRARGQRRNGTFEASKSRTFNVPVATLFEAWSDPAQRRRWLDEPDLKVRTATAPKSMRLGWPDGTIVAVWFTAKGASKSAVALAHTKLADRETADRLKAYWAERLAALAKEVG
jgi:hypothetical protein